MDCSLPGSSVHEIFQVRILEQVATYFSPSLVIKPTSPALAGRFFTIEQPGKPPCVLHVSIPAFQCEKGWPDNRLMIDICIPPKFLPHLVLGFYFLIKFLLYKGVEGYKTAQPLIGEMSFGNLWPRFSQIYIKLYHTVNYERSPNFGSPSFLTLCFCLEWIAYFFLLLFQRRVNRKKASTKCIPLVHCHSHLFLMPLPPTLKDHLL